MATGFVTNIMSQVQDNVIQDMVFKSWTAFSTNWRLAVSLMIILLIIVIGFQALAGASGFSIGRASKSLVIAFIAWVLFTQWAYFSMFIFDVFMKIPNELATTLTKTISGNSGGSAYSGLDDLWTHGMAVNQRLWSMGGWSSEGIGFAFIAILQYLVMLFTIVVATGFILVVKVMLAVLLIISPMIIPLMIFESTRGIFIKWMQGIVGFGIMQIMVVASLAFMLGVIDTSVQDLAQGSVPFSMEMIMANMATIAVSFLVFLLSFGIGASMGAGVASSSGASVNKLVMRTATLNYGHWRK